MPTTTKEHLDYYYMKIKLYFAQMFSQNNCFGRWIFLIEKYRPAAMEQMGLWTISLIRNLEIICIF